MKRIGSTILLLVLLLSIQDVSIAQEQKNIDDAGKELRMMVLITPVERLGFKPDENYPKVYAVLTDWNLGDKVASILAMKDGTASLYTTSSFGIIGGQGHERVRLAAEKCTRLAGLFYDKSKPVSEFHYPKQGQVFFYLLTFNGTRLCVADEDAIKNGTDPTYPLFDAAQDVLTELRLTIEDKIN
jgi:hypothetical protein